MTKHNVRVWIFVVGVVLAGLIGSAVSAQSWPETWTDYASNPVFDPASRAYYPTVQYDANQFGGHGPAAYYKLWYSSTTGIGHATSDDGIVWTAANGGADLPGLTNPHHARVLYDAGGFGGGTVYYKMWYWDTTLLYAPGLSIRYAESVDGITWTNAQGVFGGDNAYPWQRGSYGPVEVLYQPSASNSGSSPFNYSYVMYYDGTTGAFEQIGLAYSANGITWTRYSTTTPVFSSGSPITGPWGLFPPWDSSYVSYGAVLRGPDGIYRLWYSGGSTAVHLGIGYAESPDGINWTRSTNNPLTSLGSVAGLGAAGTWNASRNYTPTVLYDAGCFGGHGESVLYKMWRSGRDAAGNYALGYASNTACPPPATPASPATAAPAAISAPASAALGLFDPAISKTGLAPALGLPGEQIIWTITVSNLGSAAGTNVVVNDTLPDGLRIDGATANQGTVTVSAPTVTLAIPVLDPGATVTLRIETTVVRTPLDGVVINTASVSGSGVTRSAQASVTVATRLPGTGYPPRS